MLKPFIMWSTTNCGKSLRKWEYQITLSVSWKFVCRSKSGSFVCRSKSGLRHGETERFKIGKGAWQRIHCHSELICRIHHLICGTGWIPRCWEKYQHPQIWRWYHPKRESKEELKSLLMRRGDTKPCLKLNIQKTIYKTPLNIHSIQSHNSWHIDEGKVETVADFIFLGSKITMDLDCSHRIKRHLLLGRKNGYETPGQCNKSRDSLCYRSL